MYGGFSWSKDCKAISNRADAAFIVCLQACHTPILKTYANPLESFANSLCPPFEEIVETILDRHLSPPPPIIHLFDLITRAPIHYPPLLHLNPIYFQFNISMYLDLFTVLPKWFIQACCGLFFAIINQNNNLTVILL